MPLVYHLQKIIWQVLIIIIAINWPPSWNSWYLDFLKKRMVITPLSHDHKYQPPHHHHRHHPIHYSYHWASNSFGFLGRLQQARGLSQAWVRQLLLTGDDHCDGGDDLHSNNDVGDHDDDDWWWWKCWCQERQSGCCPWCIWRDKDHHCRCTGCVIIAVVMNIHERRHSHGHNDSGRHRDHFLDKHLLL